MVGKGRVKGIIDISISIEEGMIMYPGNPPVEMEWAKSPSTVLTKLSLGTHTGTHVDAPRHIRENGSSVDIIDLDHFYGPCRVLDMTNCDVAVMKDDLSEYNIVSGERILLKTKNSERGFDEFYDDYIYLDGDAAEYLTAKEVVLVGIDALSIKQRGSEDLRPHEALLLNGIPIVEGLDLSKAQPGNYIFVGLPLRLEGRDGSPIRAALIEI